MIDEQVCLQNVHRIISECSDDRNIKNLSLNELQPIYQEMADHIFRISISNTHKFKNMLWNLDNLKSGIKSKFQKEFFDKWYSAYEHLIKIDPSEDRPETEKQDLIVITEDNVNTEIATQDFTPVTEHSDKTQGQKPVQSGSDATGSILSGQVYKRDWFDKLLDFVASVMGYFLGLISR
jgi:hypothetical protein